LRQVAPTRLSPALCPVKPRLSSDSGASTITRDHPNVSVSRRVKTNRSGGGLNWDTPKTDIDVRLNGS